ncbi:hypothetical protein FGO68_gene8786 [Halteria grandinella]|uniref:Uncharacterized protein n=1 Tax=Halteria grandinella TaxID=5974 RepID=A0A8J8SZ11_HALGN|nr:hypothetical protein FGO68_gene8786 [Halteria grandinella]
MQQLGGQLQVILISYAFIQYILQMESLVEEQPTQTMNLGKIKLRSVATKILTKAFPGAGGLKFMNSINSTYRIHLVKHFTAIKQMLVVNCDCWKETKNWNSKEICDLQLCKACSHWHSTVDDSEYGFCERCDRCHLCCNQIYGCADCRLKGAEPNTCSLDKCASCAATRKVNEIPFYDCKRCARTHQCYTVQQYGYCEECDECHQLDEECEIAHDASKKSRPSRLELGAWYFVRIMRELEKRGDIWKGDVEDE